MFVCAQPLSMFNDSRTQAKEMVMAPVGRFAFLSQLNSVK